MNFIIPDFLNMKTCEYTLTTLRNHPEIFKDNIKIFGFYGIFPGCRWNLKNKRIEYLQYNLTELQDIFAFYKSLKTHLIIKFDKEDITEKELEDEYANIILKVFEHDLNYVWVKSKLLKDYIKNKYPKFHFIIDESIYEEKDKEDICMHMTDDFLKNKNTKIKEKAMYADGGYIRDYKNMFHHTKKDSVLNPIDPKKKDDYYAEESGLSFSEMKKQDDYYPYEKLNSLIKNGVSYFILSGCGPYNVAAFENIVDYLYKEDYKIDALLNHYKELFIIKAADVKRDFLNE